MKIQGPNFSNINAYKKQFQAKADVDIKQEEAKKDKLNISNEAKQLQVNKQSSEERTKYVENIKKDIQSGQYTVNYEKTAQKMIDFWSKRI